MFSSIPGLYLLGARNSPRPPLVTIKNVSRYFQKSSLKAKSPLVEECWSTPSLHTFTVSHLGPAAYLLPGIL